MKRIISIILSVTLLELCCFSIQANAITWSAWSEWTTTPIETSDTNQVENKIQYRYSDKLTTTSTSSSLSGWTRSGSSTSYGSWGSWSAWSTSSVSSNETRDVETRSVSDNNGYTLNTYYYWKSNSTLQFSYQNEWGANGSYYEFSQKTTDTPQMKVYGSYGGLTTYRINDNNSGRGVNFDSEVWWLKSSTNVASTSHTEYRYRTRTKTITYSYYKWGDWSAWSDSEYVSSTTRNVEKRTVYRSRTLVSASESSTTNKTTENSKTTTKVVFNKKGVITSIKSPKAKTITIKWKKISGASGYQCYFSKKKSFKSHTIGRTFGKKKTKTTINFFSSKKTYYAKIRPFKKVNGKKVYGVWSKVKKIKVK